MVTKECKRLAEVDFPIAVVSRHSAREKSIRHGHPSTLHLWWARRPLAACRAMLCAYYQHLRASGKPGKVALVAAMRKLLVILNAMLKHHTPWSPPCALAAN